ncbi:acylphosphatase [Halobacillus sp. Marseille-Q1614]|uniref:acylphosphatase n=1 Tax=Halobacillus sp. Marseille-Q1614 TaxID=2709134 RepID=UPI0015704199|nr:acylphosphatase [Halobacillus sp. Marseille-Q1614]
MARKQWTFHGRVQGVGFRASAQAAAKENNLNGWVKNKEDGTVVVEAEGSQDKLQSFLQEIKAGPNPFIKIRHVDEQTFSKEEGYKGFNVKY